MRGGNHHEQSDDVMFDSDRYFQTTGCSHDLSRIPCKPAGLPASHDCVGQRRCGGLPKLQESAASESCGLQLEKELAVRKRRTGGTSPIQRGLVGGAGKPPRGSLIQGTVESADRCTYLCKAQEEALDNSESGAGSVSETSGHDAACLGR